MTGNLYPEGQRWFSEGVFALRQGKNTLRLEGAGQFPNLSRIAFAVTASEITGAFAPPVAPWLTKENLGGQPRSMEEIAAEPFDAVGAGPSVDDMRRWFTTVENGRLDQRDYFGARIPSFDGRLRLNAPLTEDSVLRLSLCESQMMSIHFRRGATGLTLRTYDNKGTLVVYATSGPDKNRPIRRPGRHRRRSELAHRSAPLAAANGHSLPQGPDGDRPRRRGTLATPFAGVPEETTFEGHALFRGLALVRTTSDLPAEPPPLPLVADIARPADLPWESKLPKGMSIAKRDDGSIELKSQQAQQSGWIATPLPGGELGLNELIVELDDVTAGSNVGLGNKQSDPNPKATIGFSRDSNSGGLSFRWNNFGDGTMDFGVDYNNQSGAANAARHFWLKFVGGCGLKCYTSLDGVHWARTLQPMESPAAPLTHLAVWCSQGGEARGIRVRRVTMRKFAAVQSMAPPAEIMAKAPVLPIPNFAAWEAEVAKRKPANVGGDAWRRACALKTLAAGGSLWAIRPLVDLLADEALAVPGSVNEQLERLDELALLTDVWNDGAAAGNFMHRYELLGERLQREGNPHAWSTLAPRIVRSPLWCVAQYVVGLDRLAHTELLDTVYDEKPAEVTQLMARMRLWNLPEPLLPWASEWAQQHGETGLAIERQEAAIDHRHPFIEELNKEGFNLLGDFQAAMASKAYHDACQIVASTESNRVARTVARSAGSAVTGVGQWSDRLGSGPRSATAADDDPRVRPGRHVASSPGDQRGG